MSYEGYEQLLCENGHQDSIDAMEVMYGDHDQEKWRCEDCGGKLAWFNCVDQTNGSFITDRETGEEVRIDGYVELEVDKPAVTETCEHCGHTRIVEEETYKIPEDQGHRVNHESE